MESAVCLTICAELAIAGVMGAAQMSCMFPELQFEGSCVQAITQIKVLTMSSTDFQVLYSRARRWVCIVTGRPFLRREGGLGKRRENAKKTMYEAINFRSPAIN